MRKQKSRDDLASEKEKRASFWGNQGGPWVAENAQSTSWMNTRASPYFCRAAHPPI
jgi:hypothetical protein